jgi:hypothetical protein
MLFGRLAGHEFCVRSREGEARTLPIGFAPCPLITGRIHSSSVGDAAFRIADKAVTVGVFWVRPFAEIFAW